MKVGPDGDDVPNIEPTIMRATETGPYRASFILRMAVRETRASWRRLLFFFVCIAVGVAAIVALRSVIQTVRGVIGREARSLIAADVVIDTTRDWTPGARQKIDERLAEAASTQRTETIETPTMVRSADGRPVARMVELRAVQAGFPLYGSVDLQGGQPYSHTLVEKHGVLVRPELLTTLGLAVGDKIVIGQSTFTIRGVIAKEPGRGVGGFSLGPRVLVDYADVPSTELLGFGSRARRTVMAKVPDERIQPLFRSLRRDFRDNFVNVRSYRANDDQVGRDFDRAENYLSLVGLVIVILGGIAVSSVIRVFVLQKIKSIAVLKCVGGSNRQIIAVYLLQVMALGLAGSLLGVAIARTAISAIPLALRSSTSLLAEAQYGVSANAAAQGIAIGILVSLLFSIVPLLRIRDVKPSLLLRDENAPGRRDWLRMSAMVAVSLALIGVAAWQAASLRVGVVVCLGFAALALLPIPGPFDEVLLLLLAPVLAIFYRTPMREAWRAARRGPPRE